MSGLTFASLSAYRFLRRQVKWFGISISLRIFHILSWSTSVQFSHSVISGSLWPPWTAACQACLSGACSDSCPFSWWCHPTISSSVIPFSSCLQSFPASRSFPMSRLFASVGQSTEASGSASVLPMNIQGWFPFGLTCLIFFSPRDSQESFLVTQFKSINYSALSLLYGPILTSVGDYWENHSFHYMDFCWQSDV